MLSKLPIDIFNIICLDYLHFVEYIQIRVLNKKHYMILENDTFWNIINLSNIKTISNINIYHYLKDSKESYIYFLSGNKKENMLPLITIPNTIKNKLINCRLLIL